MKKPRFEAVKGRMLHWLSRFRQGWKTLSPFPLVDDPNENAFHALAIWLVWASVIVIGSAVMRGFVSFTVVESLDFASSLANVCGAFWIAAGVIYIVPSKKLGLAALQKHVADTFAYASRHCLFGASLIFFGYVLLLASKLPVVKSWG